MGDRMKKGKLSENVMKRSVLKQIKTKRDEVVIGAGIGEDCAILSLSDNALTAVSSVAITWSGENVAKHAVYGAVNGLAASGAEPVAVSVVILIPIEAEEAQLKTMIAQIEAECAALHMQMAEANISVTEAVKYPVVTITAVGTLAKEAVISVKKVKPGQDVVVSKWIGLEGTSVLAREKEEALLTKYPVRFMEEAKEFDRFLSIVPEAATAGKSGVCAMHSVQEGGIFGALWEMAEGAGVGLEIDLKRIPVRQETIEVCEFFELNPYELASGGCLLMTADNGYDLVRALEEKHIPATVIGKTTDNNDRVVINEEERRFLEPAKTDEIYKVMDSK